MICTYTYTCTSNIVYMYTYAKSKFLPKFKFKFQLWTQTNWTSDFLSPGFFCGSNPCHQAPYHLLTPLDHINMLVILMVIVQGGYILWIFITHFLLSTTVARCIHSGVYTFVVDDVVVTAILHINNVLCCILLCCFHWMEKRPSWCFHWMDKRLWLERAKGIAAGVE